MTNDPAAPVIQVENITRRFRRTCAVDGVSLTVPPGCVYGLLGANGAGKTTLIQHLLGSYVPQSGQVRVLGMDPARHMEEALSRIGYLSEDRILPGWMTVAEVMRFTRAFYPTWDDVLAGELLQTFSLDAGARVKTLSKGERAKTELLTALAHRPDLLILDEPSSGLDVIVRQEILKAIVRGAADAGRTVFFSSHLLDEVERVSDYVAIMVKGKIVVADTLDNVRNSHCRITIRYPFQRTTAPALDGVLHCAGAGQLWTVICDGPRDRMRHEVERDEASVVEEHAPTLEEIFVARTKHAAMAGTRS